MEVRCVRIGEIDRIADAHPQLCEHRSDLIKPALPDNPETPSGEFPYLFYALDDGAVVGHIMSFFDVAFARGSGIGWAWNLGLFTEPRHRGRGVARKLLNLQLEAFGELGITWGGVYSSTEALRLYDKMQFRHPGHAKRLFLLNDARPFMRQVVPTNILASLAGAAGNAASTVHRAWRGGLRRRHYSVSVVDRSRFPELADRIVRHEAYHWGRDANWFLARLRANDTIYGVARPGERLPCAFLILRDRVMKERSLAGRFTGFRMVSVMEFGALDDGADVDEALVGALTTVLRESRADIAEFLTASPDIEAAARRYGFLRLGRGMSFVFQPPAGHALAGAGANLADWHLSNYCGDAFDFE